MKFIALSSCNKFAIVDDEDFDRLNRLSWRISSHGYALSGRSSTKPMHRIVNKIPINMHTDHINRNRLDNRKAKLRSCTIAENNLNRTQDGPYQRGYGNRGAIFDKRIGRWHSRVQIAGKRISGGYHATKELAIMKSNELRGIKG